MHLNRLFLTAAARFGFAAASSVICVAAFVVNAIHPLVHGTFLDQNLLDPMIANLNMLAAGFSQMAAEDHLPA